jgi:hypothetical protein
MDKPRVTAKDFFLWAGAMVAFYWSVIAYIYLVFDYINYAFPNALSYYPADPYQSSISYEMASILVLLPLYLFLMKVIRGDIARDASRAEVWVRRWALIFTLFVAGVTAAIDLITLLTTFLNGQDLTTAFLLKVVVVFLVTIGVFMHFSADLRNYWTMYPGKRRAVGIAVAVLALLTIIAGFFVVGTPAQARQARLDAERVNDLQNIQYQVINYWQAKQALPKTLNDLASSLSYNQIPIDPESKASYEYMMTDSKSFKLCANFSTINGGTNDSKYPMTAPVEPGARAMLPDTWAHVNGHVCFDRTIDPAFYPPFTK